MITAERITFIPWLKLRHLFFAVTLAGLVTACVVRWYMGTLYVLVPVDMVPGYTWTHGGDTVAVVRIGVK